MLFRSNLQVRRGEIVGILGPNGAGKTTLFNLLTGFIPTDEGTVNFQGRSILGMKPHRIVNLGVGMPAGVGALAREAGLQGLVLTVESGPIGGTPAEAVTQALRSPLPVNDLPLKLATWTYKEPGTKRVRVLVSTEAERLGYALTEYLVGTHTLDDAIGNVIGLRAGREAGPPVMTGSHIDTVRTGGRYDGNYGVLAGLEVVRALNDAAITTDRPVAVAIWTNEEGSRFTPVMMGSGVYAGAFSLEHCLARTDLDGATVADELARIGYAGTDPAPRFAAYFEPHIEQGPILEAERITIGAVEGALGQRWFDVVITGQDSHAGPTPMETRKDAMVAAARGMLTK